MLPERAFVSTVARSFVEQELPGELDVVDVVIEEVLASVEGTGLGERSCSGASAPLAFGLSELGQFLQSPAVVAALVSIWTGILAPTASDVLTDLVRRRTTLDQSTELLKRRLHRQELRSYVVKAGVDAGLQDDNARRLATYVVRWLERHPEHLETLLNEAKSDS